MDVLWHELSLLGGWLSLGRAECLWVQSYAEGQSSYSKEPYLHAQPGSNAGPGWSCTSARPFWRTEAQWGHSTQPITAQQACHPPSVHSFIVHIQGTYYYCVACLVLSVSTSSLSWKRDFQSKGTTINVKKQPNIFSRLYVGAVGFSVLLYFYKYFNIKNYYVLFYTILYLFKW